MIRYKVFGYFWAKIASIVYRFLERERGWTEISILKRRVRVRNCRHTWKHHPKSNRTWRSHTKVLKERGEELLAKWLWGVLLAEQDYAHNEFDKQFMPSCFCRVCLHCRQLPVPGVDLRAGHTEWPSKAWAQRPGHLNPTLDTGGQDFLQAPLPSGPWLCKVCLIVQLLPLPHPGLSPFLSCERKLCPQLSQHCFQKTQPATERNSVSNYFSAETPLRMPQCSSHGLFETPLK